MGFAYVRSYVYITCVFADSLTDEHSVHTMSVVGSIVEEFLEILVPRLSSKVREALERAVDELDRLAEDTENEYDDELVTLLRAAVGYPEE